MHTSTGILLMLLLLAGGCVGPPEEGSFHQPAVVHSVIDGDTLLLTNGERVRLLGLNAPEEGEPCSREATEWLRDHAAGNEVLLETGNENRDIYQRLLRYVWIEDRLVNVEMVRGGLAHVYFVGSRERHESLLRAAQEAAMNNESCFWKPSDEWYMEPQCLTISEMQFDAPGEDGDNPNGEQWQLVNGCNTGITLTNWTAKDEATHQYVFPAFTLMPGSAVWVHSGKGKDFGNHLFMGQPSAIWNNDRDTLFLRNEKGELILHYTYAG